MGRIPTGLLDGTWIDPGSFHQCLDLPGTQYCFMFSKMPLPSANHREGWHRPHSNQQFNLTTEAFKYLTSYAHFFRYLNLTTGLCVPQLCSKDDIQSIAVTGHNYYKTGFTVNVDLCTNRSSSNEIALREIIATFFIVAIISLNIAGTITKGTRGPQFLSHFNFAANWKKLFQPRSSDAAIPALDGIKTITMAFMILVHIFFLLFYPKYLSSFKIPGTSTSPLVVLFFLGPFTVDTFFLITGLEMTLQLIKKRRPFNLTGYLLMRYIRFVTVIGWTICCYIVFFSNHVRDIIGGPYWPFFKATGTIPVKCGRKWPLHILLIAHYFNVGEDSQLCLLGDWYLEADYLFTVLFLAILIPSLKGKLKASYVITIIFIIFGSVIIGLVMHFGEVQHTWQPLMYQDEGFIRYLAFIHGKPWGHISPYFIGVLLGLKFYDTIKVNKVKMTSIWIIWIICWIILMIYESSINLNLFVVPYSVSLAYGMFSKIIWSFIVGWVIYACQHGYSHRWMEKFLSFHAFTVLSRINLSVLFVNLLVVRLRNATLQSNSLPILMDIIYSEVIPLFVIIYAVSFVFSVLVEGPTINLIKQMATRKPRNKKVTDIALATDEAVKSVLTSS
ncbi:nose resistant to fluoxetine protein 6 isoform X2 [Tetranychus urticae]|nr:nose resistant to fluoxetine protein 6 isoform X2 [Tetranychus urticae]